MKKSSLIGHVIELYGLARGNESPPDSVVGEFFRERRYLGSHDRRFIAEAVYGIIRYELLLSRALERTFARVEGMKPESCGRASGAGPFRGRSGQFLPILMFAAYVLICERADALQAVADFESTWNVTVPHIPMREFFSALRNSSTSADSAAAGEPRNLAELYSFPEWLVDVLAKCHGVEWTSRFLRASNEPAHVTVRVNTLMCSVEEVQEELARSGINSSRTSLSPFGLTLERRTNLEALPLFKNGAFEVQDEGSQVAALLASPRSGERILEVCAGAGGKTLELMTLMPGGGEIVATDASAERLQILRRRVGRMQESRRDGSGTPGDEQRFFPAHGGGNMRVTVLPPSHVEGEFNIVFVDAPCSGLGTVRRNPWLKNRVTEEEVDSLHALQSSILRDAARRVMKGGRLIYVTCTVTTRENEEVVDVFLSQEREFRLVPAAQVLQGYGLGSLADDGYLRLYPHLHGTDAFFGALFERSV